MAIEREFRYRVVDVFTERALEGNPLAVFPDASNLDAATMQRIARELNLSETTFVLPATRADCAARVRIFTPSREMPFAGHPTIGTGYVLLDERRLESNTDSFALEEGVGPVRVRIERESRPMLWLETPPIQSGRCCDAPLCAEALGLRPDELLDIAPQWLSAGNPTIFVALRDARSVDRASLDLTGMRRLRGSDAEPACVFVFAPTPAGAYARMFAPEYGVSEDPATGSSTGPLALFMMRHGLAPRTAGTRLVSEQGTRIGRRSLLHVLIRGENGADGIEVGGHVTPVSNASMRLAL
ncbi:MAG TPA: PhzF family phenazine biosynthesis protein [Steroidobacteraceae bacterium]|nr:PhzF family phenazine biosynthesis protein [Steroidobacteraceae bacterium]